MLHRKDQPVAMGVRYVCFQWDQQRWIERARIIDIEGI